MTRTAPADTGRGEGFNRFASRGSVRGGQGTKERQGETMAKVEFREVVHTEVTLPDGSKAWFEKRGTAERVCGFYGECAELFGGEPKPLKAEKTVNVKSVASVGKTVKSVVKTAKGKGGRKPAKPVAVKVAKPSKETEANAKPKGRKGGKGYAEKTCGVCGELFKPRSGRQGVCDACKKNGWKTCETKRRKTKDGEYDAGAIASAKPLKPVKAEKIAKEKPCSDALAEIRRVAKEAHLGPYNPANGEGKGL